ncbi:hypothetical protein [Caldicellulosiruptor kronotskyensis]|nr:hypothetical protein [Caldicellulosiruptor kronotskyensis]
MWNIMMKKIKKKKEKQTKGGSKMTENIVSKIEELLKTFEEGLEKIVKREKDLAEYSIELRDLSRILCFQFIT